MTYDSQKYHRRSIRLTGYDYSQGGAYFVTVCAQDRARLFGEVVDGQMHLNDAGRMVLAEWVTLPDRFPGVELDAFCVMPNHIHGIITISTSGLNTNVDVNGNIRAGLVPALDLAAPAVSASGAPVPGAGVNPGATTRVAPTGIVDTGMIDGTTVDVGTAAVSFEQATESTGRVGAGLVPALDLAVPVVSASGAPVPGAGVNPGATTRVAPTGIVDMGMASLPRLGDIVGAFKSLTTDLYIQCVKQSGWPPFRGRLWQRNYYEHIIRSHISLNRMRQYILDNPADWASDRENPGWKG